MRVLCAPKDGARRGVDQMHGMALGLEDHTVLKGNHGYLAWHGPRNLGLQRLNSRRPSSAGAKALHGAVKRFCPCWSEHQTRVLNRFEEGIPEALGWSC